MGLTLCTAAGACPWLQWLVRLLRRPGKYGRPIHKSKETALPKPSPAFHEPTRRPHTCGPPSCLPGVDTRPLGTTTPANSSAGGEAGSDFGLTLPLHLCIPAPGSPLGSGINQMQQGLKVAQFHRRTALLRVGRGRSNKAMGTQSKPGSHRPILPGTWEAEAGGLQILDYRMSPQGHGGQQSKIFLKMDSKRRRYSFLGASYSGLFLMFP